MLGDVGKHDSVSGNVCDKWRRNACEIELMFDSSLFSRNWRRYAFQTVHIHSTLSVAFFFLFPFFCFLSFVLSTFSFFLFFLFFSCNVFL